MFPTCCDEFVIDGRIHLTVIDIEDIDASLLLALNENFVDICEGASGTNIATVKRRVSDLFSSKNDEWIAGAIAEFFVHLYIRLNGFRQECMYLNLEENSIKKGFDGLYSMNGVEWLMESKAGFAQSQNGTHADKVKLAMSDLSKKVSGKDRSGKRERPNNPWQEAYSHASHCDVGTAEQIRKNIKKLANDFVNGKFKAIEEFNTMPCGTVFLSGIWNAYDHYKIKNKILEFADKLKGKNVHVICVTQRSIDMFVDYIHKE